MTDRQILDQLKDLLVRLEIDLRAVKGEPAGGLCRVGGRSVLMCNPSLSASQQVALLCRELRRLDLSRVFVLPAVRQRIGPG